MLRCLPRLLARGAMGRRINPSWGEPIELHNWCNKGRGMCSLCGGSGFPLSLSEWSFTICPTPYNRKIKCVECVVK